MLSKTDIVLFLKPLLYMDMDMCVFECARSRECMFACKYVSLLISESTSEYW